MGSWHIYLHVSLTLLLSPFILRPEGFLWPKAATWADRVSLDFLACVISDWHNGKHPWQQQQLQPLSGVCIVLLFCFFVVSILPLTLRLRTFAHTPMHCFTHMLTRKHTYLRIANVVKLRRYENHTYRTCIHPCAYTYDRGE